MRKKNLLAKLCLSKTRDSSNMILTDDKINSTITIL